MNYAKIRGNEREMKDFERNLVLILPDNLKAEIY